VSSSPNAIFVRAALQSDSTIVHQHVAQSQAEAREYRGAVAPVQQKQDDVSLVAGVGATVFGSLVMSRSSESEWIIAHVFVEKVAREIGIGDALVLNALAFLKSQNATWIGAQAQPGDRALKNLFERHGLVAQTIIVGRSLSDPSIAANASQ
jgi:GNAT superfamily N-acetyltransferase